MKEIFPNASNTKKERGMVQSFFAMRAGEKTPKRWSRDWKSLGQGRQSVRDGHKLTRQFVERVGGAPVLFTTWACGEDSGRRYWWRVAVNVGVGSGGMFLADVGAPEHTLRKIQGEDATLWEEASRLLQEELARPEEARDMPSCPSRVFLPEEITIVVVRDKA